LSKPGRRQHNQEFAAQKANSVEINVLSSLATREADLELVPQFEGTSGHKVATTWAGTTDIMKRIAAGEVYDLVISSKNSLGELVKQGRIAVGSPVVLAQCGIGIAVRAGAPRPDVGSAEAFKRAILAAKTIGYSTGPSGVYLAGLFERMGVGEAVKSKTRQVASGMTVGPIIANGEAEIGFQQVSELANVEGIDYIGPLPAELQNITVFQAGTHVAAPNPEAAKALVRYLTTPAAVAVMRKHGLEAG
jgi:molybdate transport system substrate-binding protein